MAPEAILAGVGPTVQALFQATRTIPIVFAQALDPIGAGIVESLSRPGSNATGFIQFEYSLSGKWPELLKELAPTVSRAAIVRDASNPAGIGQWAVMQALAPAVGMELTPIGVRDANEIERGLSAFARGGSGGLIAAVGASVIIHRDLIIAHAVRHRLPAVYPYRYFVAGGGLISYGPDLNSLYRQAAGYVDRILKGEKPGDLPVQAPTRYELVINLQDCEDARAQRTTDAARPRRRGHRMRRREFITLLGGAAAAWPLAARAQRAQKMPMVGFLHPGVTRGRVGRFGLVARGISRAWLCRRRVDQLEARWARGKPEALPQLTQELIQLGVDVLVPTARPSIEAARAATTTLPIVANDLESDPIASGYVASLARPGGNLTGVIFGCADVVQQVVAIYRRRCAEYNEDWRFVGRDHGHFSA